ncbi:Winged helix-turn-helix DNA-binding domain,Linker histone H1/H5, domain H15,Histone H5 [Cinara cedri]|uniref:Winged helix-turn-helix DNA-binding domain,Linker histone H1/H5, domain H15,Histone H5 n=1 Tax=Cinara cedri TaxID=506608 RepID=A0A5E4NGR4_9HEMI|nr:Winged helix-turn-helix DNA-binding domain,Linker histone H1/H5, domain H15,Histone H5 [Cinara cedri]
MAATAASTPVPSAPSLPVIKHSPSKKKVFISRKDTVVKKSRPAHPSTAVMVTTAIKELNERKGSSLAAIKKYIAANYKVEPVKVATFIRKFLAASVTNGAVLQIKGRYKLDVPETKPKKKAVAKKSIVVKKVKLLVTSTPKKKPAAKKSKITSGEPATKKAKKTPPAKASKAEPPVIKSKKKSPLVNKPSAATVAVSKTPKKAATKKPALKKK